jgi:hypothetical protein
MFELGILLLTLGYAGVYTGSANLINGGMGPRLPEALGFKTAIAPPGSDAPNLTGQPPAQPNQPSGTPGGGGGTSW